MIAPAHRWPKFPNASGGGGNVIFVVGGAWRGATCFGEDITAEHPSIVEEAVEMRSADCDIVGLRGGAGYCVEVDAVFAVAYQWWIPLICLIVVGEYCEQPAVRRVKSWAGIECAGLTKIELPNSAVFGTGQKEVRG